MLFGRIWFSIIFHLTFILQDRPKRIEIFTAIFLNSEISGNFVAKTAGSEKNKMIISSPTYNPRTCFWYGKRYCQYEQYLLQYQKWCAWVVCRRTYGHFIFLQAGRCFYTHIFNSFSTIYSIRYAIPGIGTNFEWPIL